MHDITEDVLVDARELMCPMPVMAATKAMRRMQPLQVLKMLVTDRGAMGDFPAWADDTGHELVVSGELARHAGVLHPQGRGPRPGRRDPTRHATGRVCRMQPAPSTAEYSRVQPSQPRYSRVQPSTEETTCPMPMTATVHQPFEVALEATRERLAERLRRAHRDGPPGHARGQARRWTPPQVILGACRPPLAHEALSQAVVSDFPAVQRDRPRRRRRDVPRRGPRPAVMVTLTGNEGSPRT